MAKIWARRAEIQSRPAATSLIAARICSGCRSGARSRAHRPASPPNGDRPFGRGQDQHRRARAEDGRHVAVHRGPVAEIEIEQHDVGPAPRPASRASTVAAVSMTRISPESAMIQLAALSRMIG